jgi:hypothetical protein
MGGCNDGERCVARIKRKLSFLKFFIFCQRQKGKETKKGGEMNWFLSE